MEKESKKGNKAKNIQQLRGDVYVKFTPQGVILGKGGKHISFEGESGRFMRDIIKRDWLSSRALVSKLLSILSGANIKDSYEERIKSVRGQKISLFISEDNIGKQIVKIMKEIGVSSLVIKYFPVNKIPQSITEADSFVIYHNTPQTTVLSEINKIAISKRKRLIRAYREINRFIIAPFVIPGETPCYGCYTTLKTNNKIYDYDTLAKEAILMEGITPVPGIIASFCAYLFVIKIIRFLGGKVHFIEELQETVIDLNDFTISYNPILKLPNCPVCSLIGESDNA